MTDTLAIALAQLNPTVGDIDGNAAQVRRARAEAKGQGADLVIYSELNLCGYPPEDLVLKPAFQERCEAAVRALAAETADGGPALLIGSPWRNDGKLHNAAALLADGAIAATRYKCDLPNYGVFDEKRVFVPGPPQGPVSFRGVRLGVMVCEDMWNAEVTECLAETGAEILMLGNGSPYEHEKHAYRIELAAKRVAEFGPADHLCQPGRRPGRARVRRRLLRAGSRRQREGAAGAFPRDRFAHALAAARHALALHLGRNDSVRGRPRGRSIRRWCWACAITSTRTASPA